MSGSDYGRATGQHEQPRQQAQLPMSTILDVQYSDKLSGKDLKWMAKDYIRLGFIHHDRIRITHFAVEDWRDRDEKRCDICGTTHNCDECPECANSGAARAELAREAAYEEY